MRRNRILHSNSLITTLDYNASAQPAGTELALASKLGMQSREEAGICHWRKVVDLGSGRTGSVALCIEQISTEDKTCGGENKERVFHAVKRVPRKCTTNSGSIRRIMQEKKALELLKGVRCVY